MEIIGLILDKVIEYFLIGLFFLVPAVLLIIFIVKFIGQAPIEFLIIPGLVIIVKIYEFFKKE